MYTTIIHWCIGLLLTLSCLRPAYGGSFVFVSLLQKRQIVTFSRDTNTGELQHQRVMDCSAEPAFLAASENGRILFVALRSSGQLAAYQIDPTNGLLRLINTVDGGADPAFLIPDRSGRFLLTAYYVDNKVTVHSISDDGRLSNVPVCSVSTADNAHGIAIDSQNKSVYVSHTGANRIDQFRLHAETGHLTPLNPPFTMAEPGQNPRHVVLHPSDAWAYCSNEAGGSHEDGASMYQRNKDSMLLTLQQSVSSLPADFDAGKNSTSRCLITPNGRLLYVANRGHDSIAGFAIDQTSGRLKRVSITETETVPRSFTVTRDGRHLYAAGEASGKVAAYQIENSGDLASISTYSSGPVSWAILSVETQPH